MKHSLPLAILMLMLTASCGKIETTTVVTSEPAVVEWPALKALDTIAIKVEGLLEKEGAGDLVIAAIPDVRTALKALVESSIPANAQEPEEVKELLSDTKQLLEALSADPLPPEDKLREILGGLHTLAEMLMHAAGVPHVHD